ncbi:hypothetical protein C3B58_07675 [Lactonifactor longoviformis]|uniref:Uncharacterized protein n=1 Tax=Lactonifactor longoviformis DSM 17459 TaxID=1122155 RepID=A0A1M5DDR2_9CLOT|nr:hypothetical protein [Lactonifactor longoviformis]POP33372.1 hypothetical protein C3B58_07675 [Lactonifactor longoviformis]SHF65066.1 hypothetical protein SAMN02745158_04506 [Lactonifactor longoviformis DSM 17459]
MTIKTHISAGVAVAMNRSDDFNQFILDSIHRHLSGDWGEVSDSDMESNNTDPLYSLSAYIAPDGQKIWIKQDCTILTVLFPEEY